MSRVCIVTDSGADLTPDVAAEAGVRVVPLTVTFGQQEYRDSVDLSPERFYQLLREADAGSLPRTTQPSPADFEEVYRPLVEAGCTIVSVHMSARVSGTLQSAALAARSVGGEIHVVDSKSASLGTGLLVLEAARLAAAGTSAGDIVRRLEALRDRQKVFFSVDTLEYLQRNGRIGKAQAFVGGLLNVKPILTLVEGEVHPLERVRGRARVHSRLVELAAAAAGTDPVRIAVLHGDAPGDAERLAEALRSRLAVTELRTALLGPTVGTHVGPGTLGVAVQPAS